ncbi:hypothetical protein GCM10025865_19100 [Paraoerskovia sediminicola]|uniref:D-alanyl-D-alanine carboxypeptidase-like core domain-containing protein n=1 Tax=Paraoerskovia sediminicola TaxID=1138587 RepID=A0ABM8G3J9_9CELL|nr:M15 family metallopeptidase [Paraoerskovia sediminicola]BDZ42611.1 hypothetical protein GCM10025865_19100 [Paraoerskovia sediminicola]
MARRGPGPSHVRPPTRTLWRRRAAALAGLLAVVLVVVVAVTSLAGRGEENVPLADGGAVVPVGGTDSTDSTGSTESADGTTVATGATTRKAPPPPAAGPAVRIDPRIEPRWTELRGEAGFLGLPSAAADCTPSASVATSCAQEFDGGSLVWRADDEDAATATYATGDIPDGAVRLAEANDPESTYVVVNKRRELDPVDYAPDTVAIGGPDGGGRVLRADAAEAVEDLLAGVREAGMPMYARSAYRSYAEQRSTYSSWVSRLGKERADVESARAGYSEHQTGLAADLVPSTGPCRAYGCMAGTDQARWIEEHAYEYGLIVRFPEGAQDVTGYIHEPWHVRYVGKALAADMRDAGEPVLETYLGLPAAPDYD